ncbi:hypothetical protein M107_3108 [Bacteroides fragilis str. 3725 D9(v)]|nr:hypothetical protein M117_2762 [Bacteroides fragilis str. 3774 T13]EXZ09375.1 hypothetical protein M073_2635 [Bacteroides fragilis str. DS-71]EXZ62785.1 hypothetical protein M107_3108 [Bacteroides fragilis str. 3725 D9(v)]EYA70554.1 hypothetical protein M132_2766 [Bacteroides fragilis str. S24L15]EYA75035.1 hypothetical protein M133_2853 [Bacteroides fragilis str. S24L26]OCR35281.1 hypothetical protein AC141_30540 [Bacteroides fragilis]
MLTPEQNDFFCVYNYANRPEALYAYGNIHNSRTVCLPGIDR